MDARGSAWMGKLRAAWRALTGKRSATLTTEDLGALHDAGAVPMIDDGGAYGMPTLLPRQMEAALARKGKLKEYLTESARATFRFQFDTPYRSADDVPFSPVTEDPLQEWNWSTREYVLTNTHAAYQRNPIAKRGVNYVSAFVVGEGFNLTPKNDKVKEVLDAFCDNEDNAVREYERQAVKDLLVDGELMIRFFEGNGEVVMAPLRPWECQFIETEPGFFRRKKMFRFQFYKTAGDSPYASETEQVDIDAKEILHVAINRHGYELRGRPELYSILPWLRAYKDWLENRARQNHWRNALLWLVRVTAASPNVIAAVAARWRKPPSPGSVAVESDKVDVQALSNTVGSTDAGEDGRQIKLMSAVGLGIPEYMLSDGENANLATATKQELPALTTFEEYQTIMIEQVWYPVFRRVLQAAVDAGVLPEEVDEQDVDGDPVYEDMDDADDLPVPVMPGELPAPMPRKGTPRKCKTVDAFDVKYSPMQNNNIVSLAQALQIAAQYRWVDNETATNELGFDYAIVQKRLKRDQMQDMRDVVAGLKPMPPGMAIPGMPGADTEESPGANEGASDAGDSEDAEPEDEMTNARQRQTT